MPDNPLTLGDLRRLPLPDETPVVARGRRHVFDADLWVFDARTVVAPDGTLHRCNPTLTAEELSKIGEPRGTVRVVEVGWHVQPYTPKEKPDGTV